MKNIFNPNDTLTNKISFYHLLLFVIALPFDQFYSEVILVSFITHTCIHLKKEALKQLFRKEVLVLVSVFLITLVCTVYTANQKEAFNLLSRQAAILLLPVFLFLNPVDLTKYAQPILLAFAFACTIAVCFLYADAIRIIRFNHLPFSSLFSSYFMHHNFSEPIAIHATYLSLFLAVSLVALVYYFLHENNNGIKLVYALAVCMLLMGLLQLGSKATLIALLLILCFVVPFSLNGNKRLIFLSLSFLLALLLAVAVIKVDAFRYRFLNGLKEDLSEQTSTNSIADPRLLRWEVAFDLVKQSPLIGYGSGDEVDLLKEKYFNNKLYDAYLNNLNAHNQYISFLLIGGVLALAIYLFTLGYGLRLAIQSRNFVFIGFIILLAIVSVSENVLYRNKGIFFYSFFFSFFVVVETKKQLRQQMQHVPT